jgi:hypothetical protein
VGRIGVALDAAITWSKAVPAGWLRDSGRNAIKITTVKPKSKQANMPPARKTNGLNEFFFETFNLVYTGSRKNANPKMI